MRRHALKLLQEAASLPCFLMQLREYNAHSWHVLCSPACSSSEVAQKYLLGALRRHTVQGKLRVAHCGGFHAAPFHVLVKAVKLVATLLGHLI